MDTMPSIQDRIEQFGITMEAVNVPENPHMMRDTMPEGSQHFHITLARPGVRPETMTTYFSVGPGIVDSWRDQSKPVPVQYRKGQEIARRYSFGRSGITVADKLERDRFRTWARSNFKPALRDVLDCLAREAADVENYGADFEGWAADMGADPDSRSAEKAFNTMREQARALACLFDTEEWRTLLFETEPE